MSFGNSLQLISFCGLFLLAGYHALTTNTNQKDSEVTNNRLKGIIYALLALAVRYW